MYYSSIGILALIILLIVNNDILIKRGTKDEDPAHHTYRAFLIFVTVYFVTDILWGILYEHHLDFLVFADTSIYFLSMAFTILFWTRFVISYLEEDSPYGKAIVLAKKAM